MPFLNINTVKAIGNYSIHLDGCELSLYKRGENKHWKRLNFAEEKYALAAYNRTNDLAGIARLYSLDATSL